MKSLRISITKLNKQLPAPEVTRAREESFMFGWGALFIFIWAIIWAILDVDFLRFTYDLKHDNKLALEFYSAKKDLVKLHKLLFKLSWEEFCKHFYEVTKYKSIDGEDINFILPLAQMHYPEKIPDGLTADFISAYIDNQNEYWNSDERTFADICDPQSEYWNSDKRTFADICDAFKAVETCKAI